MSTNAASAFPPPHDAAPAVRLASASLSDSEQAETRELIRKHGIAGAAMRLGVPRSTVQAGASGCGLREGTRLLFSRGLARHRENPSR